MANINGTDWLVTVDSAVLTDQTEGTFNMTAASIDTSHKGSGGFTARIPGQRSATMSVSGLSNTTGSAASVLMAHMIAGTTFPVTFGFADSGAEDHSYSGTFLCTSFEESAGTEDTVTYSATFESTGVLALDTVD